VEYLTWSVGASERWSDGVERWSDGGGVPEGQRVSVFHPERMEITQPRVARNELPWESAPKHPNPERALKGLHQAGDQASLQPFQG